MTPTASAIVAAYNEAKTLKPIVETLLKHPRLREIIVVDDGSTDQTWQVIQSISSPKLIPVRHTQNLGKGAAIARAAKMASGEVLLLVDADLVSFHPLHVDLLLTPLAIDQHGMTIGLRNAKLTLDRTFGPFMKSLGGERAIRRQFILPLLERINKSGYGIETILNLNHIHHGWSIYYVPLPKLVHRLKQQKHSIYKYATEYVKENAEIIKQYLNPENKALEAFLKQLIDKLGV